MGYVAARGGTEAIQQAEELVRYYRLRGGSAPIEIRQIQDQFRLAVDKVMGEGSLYSPFHAALALKQAEGDTIEAVLLIRAFRSTCPRTRVSLVADTSEMRVRRRISAAFQDVPGGQLLGPTVDYTQRLLNFSLCEESETHVREFLGRYLADLPLDGADAPSFGKVVEILKREGMVAQDLPATMTSTPAEPPYDITRTPFVFPAPRSARLQALARGETGGLLALAYSSMRGYGDIHPTVGELRVGTVPLRIPHPAGGEPVFVGRVLVTEVEVIAWFDGAGADGAGADGTPMFTLGYGLCFGHNELKAISMAVLDRAMNAAAPKAPAEDEEFVLSHIDPIESSGFASHWKLPHYVTFQADIDRLRCAQRHAETAAAGGADEPTAGPKAVPDPVGADREGG